MPAEIVQLRHQKTAERSLTGRNVSIDIHFVRHGEKRKDGNLRRSAVRQAEIFGKQLGLVHAGQVHTEIYSGTKERVRETAAGIARGIHTVKSHEEMQPPAVKDALSHTTFLLDTGCSAYFDKVNARLDEAFGRVPFGRRRRVRQAERKNIQEWLASNKRRPDTGTASPWEVAQNVKAMIEECMDAMIGIQNGSHTNYILVTHEHVVAATIRYLLSGIRKSGKQIMNNLQNVDYLEDVIIHVLSDADGERYMYASLRGQAFQIQIDQDIPSKLFLRDQAA